MWQTQPYTPGKIMNQLQVALETADPAARRPAFQDWTPAELRAAIAFVGQLTAAAP